MMDLRKESFDRDCGRLGSIFFNVGLVLGTISMLIIFAYVMTAFYYILVILFVIVSVIFTLGFVLLDEGYRQFVGFLFSPSEFISDILEFTSQNVLPAASILSVVLLISSVILLYRDRFNSERRSKLTFALICLFLLAAVLCFFFIKSMGGASN